MEILILKNNEIYARATAEEGTAADYEMVIVENVPEYPKEKPGKGKYWELVYTDGVLSWEEKDRPLTAEERIEQVENRMNALEYPEFVQPTGAHDCYNTGDKFTYNGERYIVLIDGFVWTPDANPTGVKKVE